MQTTGLQHFSPFAHFENQVLLLPVLHLPLLPLQPFYAPFIKFYFWSLFHFCTFKSLLWKPGDGLIALLFHFDKLPWQWIAGEELSISFCVWHPSLIVALPSED